MRTPRSLRSAGKVAHALLHRVGLAVFRSRPDYHYVLDLYGRTARKHVDVRRVAPFGTLAETVIRHGRTRLHYDRLYTLYQALQHVARQTPAGTTAHLAEAGVYRGGTSYFIGATARALGLEAAHLHCFDTFAGHAAVDLRADRDRLDKHDPATFSRTSAEAVGRYLADLERVSLHVGRLQDTCQEVRDLAFGFVHLDMDLYEPTRFALEFFDARLAPAGVMVVDDYGFVSCPGIAEAVESFLADHPRYYMQHLLSGQCVLVRVAAPGA